MVIRKVNEAFVEVQVMRRLQASILGMLLVSFWTAAPFWETEAAIARATLQSRLSILNYTPPNRGAPGRTRDGGGRPACRAAAKPFTALAPNTNWGETIDAHPTFWLYLPYKARTVELILKNEQTKAVVYKASYAVPEGAGIAQFALPESAPALQPDTPYRWQFDFVCNSARQSFQVDGVIVRRSPTPQLTQQLTRATPKQRADLFARNGFWYNALKEAIALRRDRPQDPVLQQTWSDLLSHPKVELKDLISEKVIPCCKANP